MLCVCDVVLFSQKTRCISFTEGAGIEAQFEGLVSRASYGEYVVTVKTGSLHGTEELRL